MPLLENINKFFTQKQTLRSYAIIFIALYIIGIFFAIAQSMSIDILSGLTFNKTDLNYSGFQQYLIDSKNLSFRDIFLNNFFVSFFLLFAPLLICIVPILINRIRNDNFVQSMQFCKYTAKFIAVIFAIIIPYHSFIIKDTYLYFLVVPFDVFKVTYIHGIFEFSASLLSSIMSLYLVDKIYSITVENEDIQIRKKQIIETIWYVILLLILILILIAGNAYWETNITPNLIIDTWKLYIQ